MHTYTWDAENRIASIDGKSLTYDAMDRVVEEGTTLQILYGPGGKMAVMTGQTAARVYLGLPKGAKVVYDGGLQFQHPDLMGNAILGTTYTQNKIFDRFFGPFGEVYLNSATTVASFTGKTQDLDSNLYDYEFREQSPVQGRWLNPDPSGMSAVEMTDPQTLNRYSYVRNAAMELTDARGLRLEYSWWAWAMRANVSGGGDTYDFIVPNWEVSGYQSLTYQSGWTKSQASPPVASSSSTSSDGITATVSVSETVTLPDKTKQTNDYYGASQEPSCFAQLKYRPAASDKSPYNHSFWWVQAGDQNKYVISAGPSGPNFHTADPFGYLNSSVNEGDAGSMYPKDNSGDTTARDSKLSPENCTCVDTMIAAARGWPQNTVKYWPSGPNSNTFAHTLADIVGFKTTAPPDAPGW